MTNWRPPKNWQVITTIDAHTAGEPLRVIIDGLPEIPGKTILEKRQFVRQNFDYWRTGLMWEPRGHADMYGAIITEPVTPDGDLGVLFLHNEGFSTMCGHGIIALTKVVLDCGIVAKSGESVEVKIDTPAGRIIATAYRQQNEVTKVSFVNVPSFVYKSDCTIAISGMGRVKYDIAFGGAFYAFCQAQELGISLHPENHDFLIDIGRRIKKAVMNHETIEHPFEKDLAYLYGTIITDAPDDPQHHSRNVCVFAEGEVDRSPTGTGVSARAAIHFSRGELDVGQPITIEGILGTCLNVEIVRVTQFGPYQAVIPQVTGEAFITGQNQFYFDPNDPLKDGFIFR